MRSSFPFVSVLILTAVLMPGNRSADAAARWKACVSITSPKTYNVGPGYWTDGIGNNIGPSFDGTEILFGPGSLCKPALLSTQPQDYHTQDNQIVVNLGPGTGFSFTEFDLDLFWNLCDHPVVLPIYFSLDTDGVTTYQIAADYTFDLLDPNVDIFVNGNPQYFGLLSGFLPADANLQETGELVLTPCCLTDLDCDDVIGFTDLVALLASWGPTDCDGTALCDPDLDGDGFVGLSDLLMVLASWGPCLSPCP